MWIFKLLLLLAMILSWLPSNHPLHLDLFVDQEEVEEQEEEENEVLAA